MEVLVQMEQKPDGKRGIEVESMSKDGFPQEVVEALGCYVYRLIDSRNGETFYVGRGRGYSMSVKHLNKYLD